MGFFADVADFVDAVKRGDWEYAFGGLPPDMGGFLADAPVAAARVEFALPAATASSDVKLAVQASARANEIHSTLDPLAQAHRTTAVLETDGARVVAGGGRDLAPAQRAALAPGEVAAKAARHHAEVTAIQHARAAGLTPRAIATNRPFCPACEQALKGLGATITSKTTGIFNDVARWHWP